MTEPEVNLVRPYALTAGRTDTTIELPLEVPVRTLRPALAHRWAAGDVRGDICRLCTDSPSVAEISARLDLPLGVVRVLVGDLVASDYLQIQTSLSDRSTSDERRDLIGRTLRGLRRL